MKQITKKNKIFLEILGYRIELVFINNLRLMKEFRKINDLEKKIEKFYGSCLIKENLKATKIDFQIEFYVYSPRVFLPNKKDKSNFALHFFRMDKNKIITYQFLSINQFNFLLIKFVLSYLMSKDKAFFLHCSANLINGETVLFLGSSGAGKSTITSIIHKFGLPSLADDGVVIRNIKNILYAFPLPLFEKKKWINKYFSIKTNKGYPIKGIYFLKKSKFNFIKKASKYYLAQKIPPLIYNIGFFDKNFSYTMEFIRRVKNINILFFSKSNQYLGTRRGFLKRNHIAHSPGFGPQTAGLIHSQQVGGAIPHSEQASAYASFIKLSII